MGKKDKDKKRSRCVWGDGTQDQVAMLPTCTLSSRRAAKHAETLPTHTGNACTCRDTCRRCKLALIACARLHLHARARGFFRAASEALHLSAPDCRVCGCHVSVRLCRSSDSSSDDDRRKDSKATAKQNETREQKMARRLAKK